ncbi:ribonucleoprotein PTB-binding 1-like isoform X1 [Haliotis rubra]|uniref:ribonucleoprotein PTB-binding 1-like isoform X1 n=1 Tax=Haliotis rubra TaxID=36100 RepID=UPI001EE4F3F0|nr:ribonucleoprotein PTB-binding 1-like isoform X1 [Haliotis rubra]
MAATLGESNASQDNGGTAEMCNTNIPQTDDILTDTTANEPDAAAHNDNLQGQGFKSAQAEFNKERKVLIKNVPTGTCTQDIEEFLKDFEVKETTYCCQSQQAVVVLLHGEEAEAVVSALDNCELLGSEVSVCLCPSDRLLGVAHLPQDYTDQQFTQLVSSHGKILKAFLMRNQQSGKSKSYGFVEFEESEERTRDIMAELDWSELGDRKLHVDFIEENLQTWSKLQSRCLLIDNLPWDFVDVSKMREMFSCVTSPVYCQIAVKDGKSLGFGIIEFREDGEAEATWIKLQGHLLKDTPLSLSFCLPGRPAVVIYNRIMWKMDKKFEPSNKSSLLPDPLFVSPALLSSPLVKGLTNQFPQLIPTFMKSLHQLHQTYINSVMSRNAKPGLLGPAPYPPMSPIMNPNMQLGLIILIALRMQAQQPQQFTGPLARQLNLLGQQTDTQNNSVGSKPSLLGDPMIARANMLLQSLLVQLRPPHASTTQNPTMPKPHMPIQTDFTSTADPKDAQFFQNNLQNVKNLNLNLLMSLGQVMFSMNSKQSEGIDQPVLTAQPSNKGKEGLLPNPNPVASSSMRNGPLGKSMMGNTSDGNSIAQTLPSALAPALLKTSSHEPGAKSSLLGEPPSGLQGLGLKDFGNILGTHLSKSVFSHPKGVGGDAGFWSGNGVNFDDSGYVEPTEYGQQKQFSEHYLQPLSSGSQNSSSNGSNGSSLVHALANYQAATSAQSSDPTSMSYTGSGGLLPTPAGTSSAYTPSPPVHHIKVPSTPIGQKRSYSSLLPKPEPSPEGEYIIGQHSQGIGGHYADSYRKRQKLDQRY